MTVFRRTSLPEPPRPHGLFRGPRPRLWPVALLLASGVVVSAIVLLRSFPGPEQEAAGPLGHVGTIGVGITSTDPAVIARYQAVIDSLNRHSDGEWKLVPLTDYGSFITDMESGRIKAGFMGSAIACRMIGAGLVEPVANGESGGVSTYEGYVFARTDSGITDVPGLAGKSFSYVDPYTSAGYFLPRSRVVALGADPETFFGHARYAGTHEQAILDVLDGRTDAGASKDTVWRRVLAERPQIGTELRVIATGGPYPDQVLAIDASLGEQEVAEIRSLLVGLSDSEEGRQTLAAAGVDRFLPVERKDFAQIDALFRTLGLPYSCASR